MGWFVVLFLSGFPSPMRDRANPAGLTVKGKPMYIVQACKGRISNRAVHIDRLQDMNDMEFYDYAVVRKLLIAIARFARAIL